MAAHARGGAAESTPGSYGPEFRAADCGFEERLPVVLLPVPGATRRTVIVGPDTEREGDAR